VVNGSGNPLKKASQYSKAPRILWKGWTMPPYEAMMTTFADEDRSSAKSAAIWVIVFLMLCLKGPPTLGSAFGTALGWLLTYIINWLIKQNEPKVISTYGLMIVVLLSTMIIPLFLMPKSCTN
jgi:hypothetical protein